MKEIDSKEIRKIIRRLEWNVFSILELISIVVGLWFLFYPHPYVVLFTVLILVAVFGIIYIGFQKRRSIASLLIFSKNHYKKERIELQFFFIISAWILTARVFLDYHFERIIDALIPCIIGLTLFTVLLFAIYSFRIKTKFNKWKVYFPIILHSILFSCSSTLGINCVYDFSTPEVYEVKVLDKKSNKRKGRNYYDVKIESWNNVLTPKHLSVSENTFNSIEIGDNMILERKNGLFGIAWYYIVE